MSIVDFVPMNLVPGAEIIPLKIGQTVEVIVKGLKVPVTVIRVYDNGDFDGEVIWEEA